MPILVDHISHRNRPAVELALEHIVCHTSDDLLGKLGRVVFRKALQHRFQNDSIRPLGDNLRGRNHLDAVLFQRVLVSGTVISVPGKAVQLPNDDHVKQLLRAVPNHVLKLRPVVRLRRYRPVNVVPQHRKPVLLRKDSAFPKLTLNGFLPLIVRGIPGINHSLHSESLPFFWASATCSPHEISGFLLFFTQSARYIFMSV